MKPETLTISEGRLPIWRAVLSVICFLLVLTMLYYNVMAAWQVGSVNVWKAISKSLGGLTYLTLSGVVLGTVRHVEIAMKQQKIYTRFQFGPIYRTVTSKAPELEYVSVFRDGNYQVNLWYKGNKHYKLAKFDQEEKAFDFGWMIAEKLQLDMLDATRPGDFRWLEPRETTTA